MQSVSPDGRLRLVGLPGAAWQRTRRAVPAASLWSALLVFLLAYTVARSTVAAGWGIDAAPMVALAGAVFMGLLAVTPLPWIWCVSAGLVLAPVVAAVTSAPVLRAGHPLDPTGWPLVQAWLSRVADGSAFGDTAFVMFVVSWLMWVTGAWLSWCVLRWRQPMVGLIPGAAAFSTNVLNSPDQTGYTLVFLALTFALLLWTNYTGSVANALKARVKLTGDARWDFWESGLVATAAVLVLAVFLPPLSTVDRTAGIESAAFQNWAQLEQQLTHPGATGSPGSGGTATTGFSQSVGLGTSLKQSKAVVFTYTVTGNYPGPHYFRGLNIDLQNSGQWMYEPQSDLSARIEKGFVPNYGEDYTTQMAFGTFTINMVLPPAAYPDLLFYPGQLVTVDRTTVATEEWRPPPGSASTQLVTIDKLSSIVPPRSNGSYNVTVDYPDVTSTDLRKESTSYADWLQPYMSVPAGSYRPQSVLDDIHNLALKVIHDARATTPNDQATAIQDFLRNPNNFHYTLTPRQAPPGVDSLWFFLFTSHEGYCQYFATAMGDMLRSLGIPTRLVNGYGPGTYETKTARYVVRDEDAHTWVEVYFPDYGWVPFEPTADGTTYNSIPRGSQTSNLCLHPNACQPPPATPTAGGTPVGVREPNGPNGATGSSTGTSGFRVPDAGTLTKIAAALLALLLLLAAVGSRYLRPRTVMGVWKRTLVLARLAGAEIQPAETPHELSRRLGRVFPEAAASVRALAGGFVVAAYAPPDIALSTRASVMEAWASLRPLMLRRVAARFRFGRA